MCKEWGVAGVEMGNSGNVAKTQEHSQKWLCHERKNHNTERTERRTSRAQRGSAEQRRNPRADLKVGHYTSGAKHNATLRPTTAKLSRYVGALRSSG
jgi:hypothetical protein